MIYTGIAPHAGGTAVAAGRTGTAKKRREPQGLSPFFLSTINSVYEPLDSVIIKAVLPKPVMV
jgi:hypothetical protein